MSDTFAGVLQLLTLLALLALAYRPLGDYLAHVYTSPRHLKIERAFYRVVRVDADADQRWRGYLTALLAFSAVGVLFLYALLRLQGVLPGSGGHSGLDPALAWNTAVSFVTNTNWQAYAGESTMGNLAQMAGLAVQNFVSAAVGIGVAIALVRGIVRDGTDRVGNFWSDLTRTIVRVLLPVCIVFGVVFIALGMVQNLGNGTEITTLAGQTQLIPGGPVASQEVIKEFGTNGGGFFNANAAHPFENPNPATNLLEIFLLLVIPIALTRTYGTMVGSRRHGYALLGFVGVLYLGATIALWASEVAGRGVAVRAAGAAMEGKEVRFGLAASALYASATTGTSTGAVNSMHDSLTGFGGGVAMINMMLGELSPGGTGSGLYGMLVIAILAVFLAGLMVGRTPEFMGKQIGRTEITLVAIYCLVMPAIMLIGAAAAAVLPAGSGAVLNPGAQGLSEILYAYASASNNNGSAFAGLSANSNWYNVTLGLCMLAGRFVLIALVLALAGALGRQHRRPPSAGTLPTATPLFVGLHVATAVIVAGLTFFPGLALGPFAVGLS